MPKGPSGLHILELRTAQHRAQSAILTQGAARQRVLIVVPQASIIGAAQVDDNGDGAPDTLDRGVSVETARVPVDPLLSADLTDRVAPLLRALDRRGRRYDLTTDLALARGQGAPLRGHSGVILAGTTRYLDRRLQTQLVAWVRRGGRLWVAEPGSLLLRSITTTPTQATRPTQPARLDPFGFELGEPLRVRGVSLLSDPLRLWRGTDGRLDGPFDVEPIVRLPSGAVRRTVATTPDGRQVVYAAAGLGRGLVIRSGVPELGAALCVMPTRASCCAVCGPRSREATDERSTFHLDPLLGAIIAAPIRDLTAVLVASLAAGALLLRAPAARWTAAISALLVAPLLLAGVVLDADRIDRLSGSGALLGAGLLAGLAVLAATTALLIRRPLLLAPLLASPCRCVCRSASAANP